MPLTVQRPTPRDADRRIASRLRSGTALAGWAGMLIAAAMLAPNAAFANPEGPVIAAGGVAIRPGGPGQLDIVQTTSKAIIDWQRFGVGEGEHTRFQQPDANAIALNRVVGPDRSDILGRLSANGQVWLVNPNGIVFGPNAKVDVGGLIATTHDIRNDDFLAGRYGFEGRSGSTATVENDGVITVAQAGLAALVAPGVANRGTIEARLGEVTLASGRRFVVDLFGDQKINLALDAKTDARPIGADGKPVEALVRNDGRILADGGRVRMSAAAAKGLLDTVVNMSGRIQARSVEERDGEIILSGDPDGGTVRVSGTLDATGADATGVDAKRTGGAVTVTGDRVELAATARVDASGALGGGSVLIGGDVQGGQASAATLAGYNVRPARKPVPPARNTVVEAGAVIAADATDSGKGGKVVVWADETTRFDGAISAKGGARGGDGGFVETSGKLTLQAKGRVDSRAYAGQAGLWLLDPRNVTIGGSGDSVAGGTYTPAADAATVEASSIAAALGAGSSVVITTADGQGTENGTITVTDNIIATPTGDATLTLRAAQDIVVQATIAASGAHKLNLVLNANSDASGSGAVDLQSAAQITTNGGDLTIGGGSDPATTVALGLASGLHDGIRIQSGAQIQTGAGNIVMNGAGGSYSSGENRGILIAGSVATTTGNIALYGMGGTGIAGNNHGIQLSGGGQVTSNSGNVTLTGAAGSGTGTGAGNGSNHGILMSGTSQMASDAGAVTVSGTGGSGLDGGNHGLHMSGGEIRSTTGAITITGTGGTGGSLDEGVRLEGASKITSSGSAPIAITASTPDTVNSVALSAGDANNSIGGASASGAITLSLDSLEANSIGTVQSTGALTIRPRTLSTPVNVATGSTGLQLTANALGALQDGFSSITIGQSDGTGDINVGSASFLDPLVMTTGGSITVSSSLGTGSGSRAGSIDLRAGSDVAILGAGLSTHDRAITLNADRDGANGGAIETSGALINSRGGAITLGGGTDPATTAAKGSVTRPYGVRLSSGTVSSEGGAIVINGEGRDADGGHGVNFANDLTLDAGAGTIQIKGKAVATTGTVGGVVMDSNSGKSMLIRSAAANTTAIQIEGDASAANATLAYGIAIRGDTDLKATGTGGGITLIGKAGRSASTGAAGVSIAQLGGAPYIEAAGGPISVTGTAGSDASSLGIALEGGIKIGAGSRTGGSASDITLTADSMNLAEGGTPELKSSGTLTLRPETRSTSIGLAGGAGGLSLSSASLAALASGFSEVVIGDASDYGAITLGGSLTMSDPLRLLNPAAGSGGIAIDGALSVGSSRLTMNSAGPVTQTARIVAGGLELLGAGTSYTLTGDNSVGTIAANTGSLAFRNTQGFGISTVGATAGVTTSGSVSLAADTGGVWQGDPISAASLELKGTDAHYSLVGANGVDVLTVNAAELAFRNIRGFIIGTAGTTSGLSTPGATLSLSVDSGTVSQTAGITAAALELSGTSAHYSLTGANTVDVLAGAVADSVLPQHPGLHCWDGGHQFGPVQPWRAGLAARGRRRRHPDHRHHRRVPGASGRKRHLHLQRSKQFHQLSGGPGQHADLPQQRRLDHRVGGGLQRVGGRRHDVGVDRRQRGDPGSPVAAQRRHAERGGGRRRHRSRRDGGGQQHRRPGHHPERRGVHPDRQRGRVGCQRRGVGWRRRCLDPHHRRSDADPQRDDLRERAA